MCTDLANEVETGIGARLGEELIIVVELVCVVVLFGGGASAGVVEELLVVAVWGRSLGEEVEEDGGEDEAEGG